MGNCKWKQKQKTAENGMLLGLTRLPRLLSSVSWLESRPIVSAPVGGSTKLSSRTAAGRESLKL